MKLLPMANWLLLVPVVFDSGSELIDPDISKDAPDRGQILEIGPSVNGYCEHCKCTHQFAKEQLVLFGKYSGVGADKERVLVRACDIMCIAEDVKLKERGRWDATGKLDAVGIPRSAILVP